MDNLRDIRLQKLKKIRQAGIDPYPSKYEGRQIIADVRNQKLDSKVKVAGRVMSWREHGGSIFADLVDERGKIQIYFKKDELNDQQFKFLENLDIGDIIGVNGKLFKTKKGELTVLVSDYQLLTKSLRPLPSSWYGFKDVEERYRKRYLDLIANEKVKEIFQIRSKVISLIRKFLDGQGFLEVETPILQPMYGGASAQPFITHHNALDCDLYLRISDELYLKRLIVGGFEKVYEVGKDFRNEGIDRAHNPEFTQVEFYWAYADYEDLMELTEELSALILNEVLGETKVRHNDKILDFTPPLPRVNFHDFLLKETSIDTNNIKSENDLLGEIKKRKMGINLEGVIGLGAIYDKLYKEKIRPKIVQPTFLLDYPASMIALAKRKENDSEKIASFQLIANGAELVKAYNELNDPLDQEKRWRKTEELAKRGDKEAERLDKDYIDALEYGMPPTAGWGMGVDRLVAFITAQRSLKEVILFPTMKPRDQKKQ